MILLKAGLLPKLILYGVLLVVLPGCLSASGSANVKRIDDNTIDTSHPRAELVLATKRLVGAVVLTNVRFGTAVNFQRVEVGLQNILGRAMSLEYKVDWQDAQGFTVNQHSIWNPIKLDPREIKNIQSLGKVPEAWQILLTVRVAK